MGEGVFGKWFFDILRLGIGECTWLKIVQKNTAAWILQRSTSGRLADTPWLPSTWSLLFSACMETSEYWYFADFQGRNLAFGPDPGGTKQAQWLDPSWGAAQRKAVASEAPVGWGRWRLCQTFCFWAVTPDCVSCSGEGPKLSLLPACSAASDLRSTLGGEWPSG